MNKQRMRRTLWSTLAAAGMICMVDQGAQAQSLSDAVAETMATNPQVHFDATRVKTLEQQVEIERAGYRPKADLELGIGREWLRNAATLPGSNSMWRKEANLSATQMLYDGYATKSRVDAAQSKQEEGQYNLLAKSEAKALETSKVYLEVLRHQQLLKLTQENVRTHEEMLKKIKKRYDAGVGSKADLDQAQGRLALAQSNLNVEEGNLWEAQINFERVVGHPPQDLQMPTNKCCQYMPSTADDAVKIALSQHPSVLKEIAGEEAAMADVNLAKAAFHPKVDLELSTSYNHGVAGENYRTQDRLAMLRMRYNAYNGGADSARVDQTRYLSDEQRQVVLQQQRDVAANAREGWNKLDNLYRKQPKLEKHEKAAKETRDAYAHQFDLGQRTLLDLLDSENEYFTARSDRVNGVMDEWYARYSLLADVSKLMKALEVKPDFDTIGISN